MTEKIGVDDLAEDVFGLNIRGLRSIGVIWIRPAVYFSAAQDAGWDGRFTPSIRLWLSLIALTSLFQFIWIGSDTPLVAAYAEGFRNAGLVPPEGMTLQQLGERAALWIYALAPMVQLALFLLVLGFFPFWGERATYSLALRRVFGVMIPSATLLVLFLPALALVPSSQVAMIGYVIGAVTFLLDALTGYRAAFPVASAFGRLWRAALLALCILILNVIANVGAQIAGIVLVSYQFGLSAG
ncbi:hypothetical protein [Maricaulis parjimensis]|uniref:hypothetical protein n=1 Tax=Maricaulis parjimensis TaxID=144023 RepID=UPI0019397EF1|nr:hypothetical protein [Maricaulis parjimensis]